MKCTEDGWDAEAECVVKEAESCPNINVVNGAMECKDDNGDVTTSMAKNVKCNIKCDTGYEAVGDTSVSWNPTTISSLHPISFI